MANCSYSLFILFCCSDGVSRTGAFCTLYSVLERVKTEQIVDVFQAVKTLRIQRVGLLSTIVSAPPAQCRASQLA